MRTIASLIATMVVLAACGTWVGNPKPKPKGDDDDDGKKTTSTTASSGGGTTGSGSTTGAGGGSGSGGTGGGTGGGTAGGIGGGTTGGSMQNGLSAHPGDVLLKKVHLQAGATFGSALKLTSSASLIFNGKGVGLMLDGAVARTPIEMSVLNPDGTEAVYNRGSTDQTAITFTPAAEGDYTVAVKNNDTVTQTVASDTTMGADSAPPFINATTSATGPFKDILLKAVVTFARECQKPGGPGGGHLTVTAPGTTYFVQPIVFLGRVAADQTVTPISTATIAIKSGSTVIPLKKIADFPLSVIWQRPNLTLPQHIAYTRAFYSGYLGGAGEMYTTDIFRFGGDCDHATTIDLGVDPAKVDIQLTVDDATQSPPISASFKVLATAEGFYSTFQGDNTPLINYTQCQYDPITGDPSPFNLQQAGDTCKTFGAANPPYIVATGIPSTGHTGATTASNPTRIMFYGYSQPKELIKTLINDSTAFLTGHITQISAPGCLSSGGLDAVPVARGRINVPLSEFNAVTGDVIALDFKGGTYTGLTDYFQGNVSKSGSVTLPTCVPVNGACAWEMVPFTSGNCAVKADSGISAISIGESFIYPEYYRMSGVLGD